MTSELGGGTRVDPEAVPAQEEEADRARREESGTCLRRMLLLLPREEWAADLGVGQASVDQARNPRATQPRHPLLEESPRTGSTFFDAPPPSSPPLSLPHPSPPSFLPPTFLVPHLLPLSTSAASLRSLPRNSTNFRRRSSRRVSWTRRTRASSRRSTSRR